MPIKIPYDLPAARTLRDENIFVMALERARTQDIRPLRILVLNLMPTKVTMETQLARLLGNTPLQVELELLTVSSHTPTHVSPEHMISFYRSFDEIKSQFFDGLVITGAPVEQMPFEEVDYWDELCEIMSWSKAHVYSTFHICWGAQAGLVVLAVSKLFIQLGVQPILHKLGNRFFEEILDVRHAADVAFLQQFPDFCSPGLLLGTSILSAAHYKNLQC